MNTIEYKDIIAFHPGYYLSDVIKEMEITQEEFAKRMGTSGKNLSEILNGKTVLSGDIALKLSKMLGTSVEMWLDLQKTYTEKKLQIENEKILDKEKDILGNLDYSYFCDLGLVQRVTNSREKVEELLKHFQIASLNVLKERDFLVSFRSGINDVKEKNIINSNAWVHTALNFGREIETEPIDLKKLKSKLPDIRSMTIEDPNISLPEIKEILRSCGVAFVLLPHLKNSDINGAVRWNSKEKVTLAMNNRGKYADIFWFSLFHEIGHVLQEKKTMLILQYIDNNFSVGDKVTRVLEKEADEFARNYLIPKNDLDEFVNQGDFSRNAIVNFAKDLGIHPGIVVGRLQKDELVGYESTLNKLKEKYELVNTIS